MCLRNRSGVGREGRTAKCQNYSFGQWLDTVELPFPLSPTTVVEHIEEFDDRFMARFEDDPDDVAETEIQ